MLNDDHPFIFGNILMQHLIQVMPLSAFWKNTSGMYMGANTHFLQDMGMQSENQLIGKTDFDLPAFAVDAGRYKKIEADLIARKKPRFSRSIIQAPDKNDTQIITVIQKIPLLGKDEEVCAIFGLCYMVDLNNSTGFYFQEVVQKNIQRQSNLNFLIDFMLDESLDRSGHQVPVDEIFDLLPVPVFWKDLDSRFVGCNQAFCHALGFSNKKQVIGKTDYDLPIKAEEGAHYRETDQYVFAHKQAKANITEQQTVSGGDVMHLLTHKVPLINRNDEVVGVLGLYSDITDLILQFQNLEKEKKLTQIHSDNKTTFISNMSHDVRTPLAGVTGMLQHLNKHAEKLKSLLFSSEIEDRKEIFAELDYILEYSKIAFESNQQILGLCNEVLEASSDKSMNAGTKVDRFDLTSILNKNIELLTPAVLKKGLSLEADISPITPTLLYGSAYCLDKVILNLLSNAVKFTAEGSVRVVISTIEKKFVYKANDIVMIQIQVQDTGIGLSQTEQESLFKQKIMNTADTRAQNPDKGFGLGLYTVNQYIKAMKGTIKVSSQQGQGSCFSLEIPLRVAESKLFDRTETQSKLVETVSTSSASKSTHEVQMEEINKKIAKAHFLLVEDNYAASLAVKLSLQTLGCLVTTVYSSADVLEYIEQKKYDLIFLDIGLPDMNGIELTKKIRQGHSYCHNVPIIALTGYDDEQSRQACLLAGMQSVMVKPAKFEDLKFTVYYWLSNNLTSTHLVEESPIDKKI